MSENVLYVASATALMLPLVFVCRHPCHGGSDSGQSVDSGLANASYRQASIYEVPGGKAGTDGALVIRGVTPARYRLSSTGPPAGWRVKSITAGGDLDLMDAHLTVPANGQVPPLVVTYTKQTTELNGTLEEASGKPATVYTVIVFTPERAYWTAQTRRVQAARPGTDGSFTFANLPAGPYLMVAVTAVEPDQWFDPDFLATLVPAGVKVTMPDGGKVSQDLRIAK